MAEKPIEFGVAQFCASCARCAEECPSGAVSPGEPTTDGLTISNNSGTYKWYIDPEKCLDFWAKNNGSCENCVRVCSFKKLPGKPHDAARFSVKNASISVAKTRH